MRAEVQRPDRQIVADSARGRAVGEGENCIQLEMQPVAIHFLTSLTPASAHPSTRSSLGPFALGEKLEPAAHLGLECNWSGQFEFYSGFQFERVACGVCGVRLHCRSICTGGEVGGISRAGGGNGRVCARTHHIHSGRLTVKMGFIQFRRESAPSSRPSSLLVCKTPKCGSYSPLSASSPRRRHNHPSR